MTGHACRAAIVWIMAIGLLPGASSGQSPTKPEDSKKSKPAGIQVDPKLITQVDQVWKLIGRPDNPVWPGWDARETPILIYMPNRQDLLINHPRPPAGFRPYAGPLKSAIGPIHIRDGETITSLDGQNTAILVGGVRTLVVADTLSSRRQWAQSLIATAKRDPAVVKDQIEQGMKPNPYPLFGMFCHEAFHVYQYRRAPDRMPNENALTTYPSLSVENNVGFALEAEALQAALEADSKDAARPHLKSWIAARSMRRKSLSNSSVDYEDATEFSEGTAKYVEYRLLECLDSTEALDNLWLIQGFQGFGDLSSQQSVMRKQMQEMMSGQQLVNNDLYGASPVRFRLYFSGMAIGAALDEMGVAWHDKIFETNATLTGLLAAELALTPEEIEAESDHLRAGDRHAQLVEIKAKLEAEGKAHIAESGSSTTAASKRETRYLPTRRSASSA